MSRCDSCVSERTCGFKDDWTDECYTSVAKEGGEQVDAKKIGRKLRELRGVFRTQDEVARAINIDRSALSRYENGDAIPSDAIKIALAAYYGVTVGEIFFAQE